MTSTNTPLAPKPKSKRSNTSSSLGATVLGINDLSNDILVAIANYLPKTSRALLAVALTAPLSSWRERGWKGVEPSDASKAVISSARPSSLLPSLAKHGNFHESGVTVKGCGVPEINGVYQLAVGSCDGVPKYSHSAHYNGRDEEFSLLRCKLTDGTRRWYIVIVPPNSHPGTTQDIDFYYCISPANDENGHPPPRARWARVPNSGGIMPGPRVYPRAEDLEQLKEYYEGKWEILDFVDIELSLSHRLTDDDLGGILVCIDAKNTLKRLKLTYCSNISGSGLEHLRSSPILEEIDMNPLQFELDSKLSKEAVLPILHDILSGEGNSFRRLKMPPKWCHNNPSRGLAQLLEDHKHVMNINAQCCYFGFPYSAEEYIDYMRESNRWDECMKCGKCSFESCMKCCQIVCRDCNGCLTCDRCNDTCCNGCWERFQNYNRGGPLNIVYSCERCDGTYCVDCRFGLCCGGNIDCVDCMGAAFRTLLVETEEQINAIQLDIDVKQAEIDEKKVVIDEKQDDIDGLKSKNDAQQEEIEHLRHEVDELRQIVELGKIDS